MNRGILMVLSGPSGVGKGEVCKRLVKHSENLAFSVSCTTRAPREGEREGREYFFISEEKYDRMVEAGEFLEHAGVHGKRYGTPRAFVLERLEAGSDILLDIDVQGGLQVKKNYPDAVMIFLLPPDWETLRARLVGRNTETADVIAMRMANAAAEIRRAAEYDYLIVNDVLDDAVEDAEAIIRAEKLAAGRAPGRVRAIIDEIGGKAL